MEINHRAIILEIDTRIYSLRKIHTIDCSSLRVSDANFVAFHWTVEKSGTHVLIKDCFLIKLSVSLKSTMALASRPKKAKICQWFVDFKRDCTDTNYIERERARPKKIIILGNIKKNFENYF